MNLSAFAPGGSDNTFVITWLPPADSDPFEILYYSVGLTNYSRAPVASVNVSMDQTSTNVTGLGI